MFGTRTKEDVTGATEAVFSELRNLYRQECQRVPVSFRLTVHAGEPVVAWSRSGTGDGARRLPSRPRRRRRGTSRSPRSGVWSPAAQNGRDAVFGAGGFL